MKTNVAWYQVPDSLTVNVSLISRVIDRIGSRDFDLTLLHFVNQISPINISEICGYVFTESLNPEAAGWVSVRADTLNRVELYVSRFHHNDPLLTDLPVAASYDNCYVKAHSRTQLEESEYRKTYFDAPGFGTEFTVIHREKHGWNVAKVFVERTDISFSDMVQLGQVVSLIYPLGRKHALNQDNSVAVTSAAKAEERLMVLLENRYPNLTNREREVCVYSILGDSAKKIGEKLNVSPNTVITYRQRAYDRLGVSSIGLIVREIL